MPDYKLMYFEARGQAEIARLLFATAGVKYEDKRYNKDTWPAVKQETPCGQLPVLVVDGQMFSQSIPIAVYLAEAFGLHGGSTIECLVINEIIATSSDLKRKMSKTFLEKDETKKAEIKKQLDEEEIPKFVKIFEKFLGKSDSGFFSKKLSVADIIVFDTLEKTVEKQPGVLSGAPRLKANMDKVRSNPGVSNWLKSRPQTEH